MLKRIGFFSFVFLVMFPLLGLIAGGSSESNAAGTSEASDTAVVIAHKYGETVLSSVPEKVVSVGWSEHETLLALGVVPIAVRAWSEDMPLEFLPYSTGPWVPEKLRDKLNEAEPVLLLGELDFEAIAALAPDVIVGITSGMTKEEYNILAQIAPTVAQPGEYLDYGTPWQVETRMLGEVLGKTEKAEQLISGIHNRINGIKERHPEFAGATVAVAFVYSDQPGVYASQSSRSRFMQQLGFVIPPEYDEMAGDSVYIFFSEERLDLLDTDIILWESDSDQDIRDLPLRDSMTASVEGRELYMGTIYERAFSYSSPPSINFLLDSLEPALAAAVDGDPETKVPEIFAID